MNVLFNTCRKKKTYWLIPNSAHNHLNDYQQFKRSIAETERVTPVYLITSVFRSRISRSVPIHSSYRECVVASFVIPRIAAITYLEIWVVSRRGLFQ